ALRLRDVVAVLGDDVGVVEVGVGARLAVTAEAFLQRLARGRRAQPGVAVQVWGADAATGYRRERVVLLEEQLAAGVERKRGRAVGVEQFAADRHDAVERGVPIGLDKASVLSYQRTGQAIGRGIGLPTEQVLHVEPTVVDPVDRAPAHPDHAPAGHRDVHRVAVGVQHRGGLHPDVDVVDGDAIIETHVDPDRPGLPLAVGGAAPPWISDGVPACPYVLACHAPAYPKPREANLRARPLRTYHCRASAAASASSTRSPP